MPARDSRGSVSGGKKSRLPFVSLLAACDALVLPVVGVGLSRFGIVSPAIGFFVALAGVLPAAGSVVLAAVSLRRDGHSGKAMTAMFIGGGFILALVALVSLWSSFPRMNDITTDPEDPVPIARADGSEKSYSSRFPALQLEGYPDLRPARFEVSASAAFEAASASAREFGWKILGEDPESGTIRAVATTAAFGFKDDVAIRIREVGTEVIVDIRSRSRVGRGDLGANARRIRLFLSNLEARLS
jgi:hypothetical protein